MAANWFLVRAHGGTPFFINKSTNDLLAEIKWNIIHEAFMCHY